MIRDRGLSRTGESQPPLQLFYSQLQGGDITEPGQLRPWQQRPTRDASLLPPLLAASELVIRGGALILTTSLLTCRTGGELSIALAPALAYRVQSHEAEK